MTVTAGNPGGSAAPTRRSSVRSPRHPRPSKNYNITFIQGVAGDEFYITMQCGAQAEASKLGVTLKTQGPQKFDPTLQTPIVDSVVSFQAGRDHDRPHGCHRDAEARWRSPPSPG